MSDILNIGLLLRDAGPIEGRKKLQKIVHLLQESGVDFDSRYELSLYGPYSAELRGCVDELVASELVQEDAIANGSFRYSPTANFVRVLKKVASDAAPAWSALAGALNARDTSELEGISTVLFLQSRGWRDAELEDRFKSLKSHLADRFNEFLDSGRRVKEGSFGVAA